jgi:hypothetical protein
MVKEINISTSTVTAWGIDGAGIGSGPVRDGGTSEVSWVSVLGSRVTAKGETGIGSALGSIVRAIMINRSDFTVTGTWGAGIGSGVDGTVNNVTIVAATGKAFGNGGAGIGSGPAVNATSFVSRVVIANCSFRPFGMYSSGIGSGYGVSNASVVGDIVIINSQIAGWSYGYGSGIGAGYAQRGEAVVHNIALDGLSSTLLMAGYGSGIGSGLGELAVSRVCHINITNCVLNSWGTYGAGIGSGPGRSQVDSLVISGGSIVVWSLHGAGIGSGVGNSSVGLVQIESSSITATSKEAAAIGSASHVEKLVIAHGMFTLMGTVGIGASANGTVDHMVIGHKGKGISIDCTCQVCFNASDSDCADVHIAAITTGGRFFNEPVLNSSFFQPSSFVGQCESPGVQEQPTEFGVLQILDRWKSGDLFTMSYGSVLLEFRTPEGNLSIVPWEDGKRGLMVSLDQGEYTITYDGHHLCSGSLEKFIVEETGSTVVETIGLCGSQKLAPGEIVGIVLGTAAALVLIYVAVIYYLRRRYDKKRKFMEQKGQEERANYTDPLLGAGPSE